ncbi:MAG: ABC transporter permease subunit [Oscillospiraceae bacterium]|nr:ABC transporter permease subunit [Oscillospiraceae bacterium]
MAQISAGRQQNTARRFFAQWDLQLLVIPSILFVLLFMYVPMYGIVMAFQEFRLGDFPGLSQWVGFKQFQALYKDPNFSRVLRNTLVISSLKLAINFPLPIIFALLINEMRGKTIKKTVQTISYLPHFISWVVAARLMFDFFSADGGAVNAALQALRLTDASIPFFNKGEYYWAMAVATDIWKELGWNSIIYIAAIAAVDPDLYEAAAIDGATRIQRVWYITLGTIRPTIVLLLIFTIGNLLNANFDQTMMLTNQMGNAMLRAYADIIDTYVYRIGISQSRFSFAAAAGLFKAVINFLLLLGANKLADRLGESALF